MKVFQEAGWNVGILPEWRDIDTMDDLRSFLIRNKDADLRKSYTLSSIMKNKLPLP
jgi:hypothetical protein